MGCQKSRMNVYPSSPSPTNMQWLDPQYHDKEKKNIIKPNELKSFLCDPPEAIDEYVLDGILGSMIGLALGDALGAHVEFRPRQYLIEHPVTDLQGGGTWGLQKGQFTDDTSMALCLAISLIASHGFKPYDQLVRYKLWYRNGYMSSTGKCFDIGAATKNSLDEFEHRQQIFAQKYQLSLEHLDYPTDESVLKNFDIICGDKEAAGNGALMRLAPVPLFFWRFPRKAIEYSGISAKITHADPKACDASRFYGALIVGAMHGIKKEDLLDPHFCEKHKDWFGEKPLHDDVKRIVSGSYKKKNGYDDGIRGKGFVIESLNAALWAFWSDENSFEKGVLAAINLGDDTDTTAAIYGQLAGAYYGYKKLPRKWIDQLYAKEFIICLSKWIVYESEQWFKTRASTTRTSQPKSKL